MDKTVILTIFIVGPVAVMGAIFWAFAGTKKVVQDDEPIGYSLVDKNKSQQAALTEAEIPNDEDWDTFEALNKETWASSARKNFK